MARKRSEKTGALSGDGDASMKTSGSDSAGGARHLRGGGKSGRRPTGNPNKRLGHRRGNQDQKELNVGEKK